MRRTWWCAMAALVLGMGCGGGAQSRDTTARQELSARSSPGSRSLTDILGPLGEHQSPAQLAEVAAFIRRWERDPHGTMPENTTERTTAFLMLAWLSESPDVTVIISPALTRLSEGRGEDVGALATMGSTFGMAAYLAEHPGVDPHAVEVQAAGVMSALLWYEASLRGGAGRNALMDELLAIRDQSGEAGLRQWWSERVQFTE